MGGAEEREEHTDGDRTHPFYLQSIDYQVQLRWVQRRQHLALCVDPLVHFQAPFLGHQRGRELGKEIIEIRAVLPADLQQISEATGADQSRRRSLAFQQGVGGYS